MWNDSNGEENDNDETIIMTVGMIMAMMMKIVSLLVIVGASKFWTLAHPVLLRRFLVFLSP